MFAIKIAWEWAKPEAKFRLFFFFLWSFLNIKCIGGDIG